MSMVIGNKTFSYAEDDKKPARVIITNLTEQFVSRKDGTGNVTEEKYLTVSYEFNYHLPKVMQNYSFFRHSDTVQLPIQKVTLEDFKVTLKALYQQYGARIKNAKKVEPIIVLE